MTVPIQWLCKLIISSSQLTSSVSWSVDACLRPESLRHWSIHSSSVPEPLLHQTNQPIALLRKVTSQFWSQDLTLKTTPWLSFSQYTQRLLFLSPNAPEVHQRVLQSLGPWKIPREFQKPWKKTRKRQNHWLLILATVQFEPRVFMPSH